MEAYLAPFQYSTTVSFNGAEAVDIVQNEKFDIILMDIQMPVMGGIEAIRKIREQGCRHAKVPIVAATANAVAGDLERYLAARMDDYVPKPVDRKALTQVLKKYNLSSGNAD